ncbi:ADP-ribosylation factor-related protein 1 [Tetrabaena socialis]|uniref:ADP-ribosylation factor-related protein 1 n=1 Tax=Tetrabaena socialis TaxID=47790 RepID=A0A2J7ZYB3_9CHLO|nr:ADP-ribosylation factor-related protein 1 [Tetrabaena socialis]|eukprot:PNH05257.1 ADP-ribosylation factor-related protein 1 [Tetrabaena socialis]
MFSLLYGFYEYMFRKDEFHVLILGVDKAGKTNVLERLKTLFTQSFGLDPGKILPTVGLNVGRIEAHNHNVIFWDLGGQSGLRSIWDKYYNEAHAVVYVVDAAARPRFDESRGALDRVMENRELGGAPLLIMANKQDLEGAASALEMGQVMGVERMEGRQFKVLPVSAYTGQGLKDAVEWLVETIKRSHRAGRLRVRSGS